MKITYPTLLLNETICKKNIQRMAEKAKDKGCSLRPHFKTHQSYTVGSWFKEIGIDKCAVSSFQMAEFFVKHGWKDITVAFPLNIRERKTVNTLSKKINLSICIESVETAISLNEWLKHPINVYLKVDAGYHRTGIDANDFQGIQSILDELSRNPLIGFKGFLQHAGHTYQAKGKPAIDEIHQYTSDKMLKLKKYFISRFPKLIISNGDTPSCSVSDNFDSIDELRPGNFVFYDVMQAEIGACQYEDIAVAMACPVVAKHPDRNEVIVYGGAIHLSKDRIEKGGQIIYGLVAQEKRQGWGSPKKGWFIKKLSQEHGTIHVPEAAINSVAIGDIIYILPIHSCLTANLMGNYYTLDNEKIEMYRFQS